MGSALLTLLLVLVFVASVAASVRIAYVGFGRHDTSALVAEQLRWLEPQVGAGATGAAEDVRDGPVLQVALTALATAQDDTRPSQVRLPLLRAALGRLDDDALAARYAVPGTGSRGAFLEGWSLLVATEAARLSGQETDRAAVRTRSRPLVTALGTVTSGVLPSYADTYRPADTVVLAAALRRADEVTGVPGAAAAVADWVPRLEPMRDPTTKLLPHRTDAAGRPVESARATSQAMIQAFWPSIDATGGTSSRDWVAFENTFLCPRLGLVAVCEFPGGESGGDALSGPLVLGVSPAATVLTMAAARAHGNTDLAEEISREAELFGAPVTEGEARHYLGGSSPVGNALLAWARSVPVRGELPGVDDRDPVAWPAWTLGALVPAVLALGALAWRYLGRRRFSGPLESDAAPPDGPATQGRGQAWGGAGRPGGPMAAAADDRRRQGSALPAAGTSPATTPPDDEPGD